MNRCSVCHGETTSKTITYTQWYEGKLIAVQNVPAEVCPTCGEEYFSPEVTDKIQKVIELHNSIATLEVPVYQLA
ncbi:MAG: YgiT-type zinc finger domain-containing protein [bacterium (Candidatus Ratteibacteria) CG_4_10_14_3_um_filter_41_18]|uniref:YgiT-type zinc finger domain-containing protein n=4 Tax=Candidatus Ratteibacteria TaxID=2979319 RepID=A0A2M7YF93_9BACT|nr:MAG: YgiT-type zinc finger domain-containing protein [bacterium (Candidatus Ratteibacteria) CG01_land_8_20_14_3_00_40_19]PIW34153.1 MAG: YgiT-type zinc finger domain-containing protein [bacterium (Candidatus Ratteibacteria) CG15_BIG_FIL_POST_REV_8_21_14_020_41_12]PIW74461.1 MAG: YgiT-type zinc finger domain-containing protein [bacterium (Candidatus Ratteibacteria) CG_4_8_14_3_um_filter_41_36]PIX76664.1 MAG: YgiT-type zinc finger domain-containing protein [bacterium (Candidatus Ratteibacteria)